MPARRPVLNYENGHRSRIDTRDGADAAVLLGGGDLDLSTPDGRVRRVDVSSQTFVDRTIEHCVALTARVLFPGDRSTRRQDKSFVHSGNDVARWFDVQQVRIGMGQQVQREVIRRLRVARSSLAGL